MNSLEDLLVLPNYTNLEIKTTYPKLPKNVSDHSYKIKRLIPQKIYDNKYSNDNIFQILLEMKKQLKMSIFNEEKNSSNNFMYIYLLL